ncbi:MAG: hypothetical protein C0415_05930 [Thermodesulfovibrio sp.]|nr:hypothetical protein [Thermodesulfovibrio sp.]
MRPKNKFMLEHPALPRLDLQATPSAQVPPASLILFPWACFYIESRVLGSASQHTVYAKMQDLQKFINYFYRYNPDGSLLNWSQSLTNGFKEALITHYETATVRRVFATLSNFAGFLEKKRVFGENEPPMGSIKPPKRLRAPAKTLTVRDENGRIVEEGKPVFERLIEAAESFIGESINKASAKQKPYRDLAILATLYYTAMRVSELCSLNITQVVEDAETDGIELVNVRGKGDVEKNAFLSAKGTAPLRQYILKERGNAAGPLFKSSRNRRLTRKAVWQILQKFGGKAEEFLPLGHHISIHPHLLRHERAYSLQEAGFTSEEIADELGHSSTQYIGVYTRRSDLARKKRLTSVDEYKT